MKEDMLLIEIDVSERNEDLNKVCEIEIETINDKLYHKEESTSSVLVDLQHQELGTAALLVHEIHALDSPRTNHYIKDC